MGFRCKPGFLGRNEALLHITLRENGSWKKTIAKTVHRVTSREDGKTTIPPAKKGFLPFIKETTDRIGKILKR